MCMGRTAYVYRNVFDYIDIYMCKQHIAICYIHNFPSFPKPLVLAHHRVDEESRHHLACSLAIFGKFIGYFSGAGNTLYHSIIWIQYGFNMDSIWVQYGFNIG